MRICLDLSALMTSAQFRGIGSYALELARAIARAPAEARRGLELLALTGRRGVISMATLAGALEEADALAAAGSGRGPVVPDPLYYALRRTVGWARLIGARADLYHSTTPKGTPTPPGMHTVATCHDLIPVILRYPFRPRVLPLRARAWVERLRYRAFDHVIAISRCTADDLHRITGYPRHRISVVHHGVDTAWFTPTRFDGEAAERTHFLGTERPYFLYVGGFDPRKRVADLVEAFARGASEHDLALVVCGRVEPEYRADLERRLRRFDLRDRLVLPGYAPRELLPALYRGASAHVMVSSYEGFGMTISEAFACGCPVIALNASCVPEIAGEAALLVAPGALEDLEQALVRLAGDDLLAARLRSAGLERAASLTWERCAAETLAVYRRVGAQRR
jgi:glycosyltransferase involved in cell wall biosynthesis